MNCDTVRELAPAFVLGALTRDEEGAVREHLATCGEPHPEFDAFGGVVHYLDETVELIEPPASLKERVLAAVATAPQPREPDRVAARATAPAAAPALVRPAPDSRAAESRSAVDRNVRPTRRAAAMRWLLGIAAVAAIIGLAGWNIVLQSQLASATAYDRAVAAVLDVAARPGSQTVILSGDGGGAPRGIAALGSDGSVVLAMRELQPTAGSEVYEAWAIAANGNPVAIGSFQAGSDGTGSLTARLNLAPGIKLALTREPRAAAGQPTTPVVAQGAASAPSSS